MSAAEQLTEVLDAKFRAPVRWLIALMVCVAVGTAAVVTMAFDVRQIAIDARREAVDAKAAAADLRATVDLTFTTVRWFRGISATDTGEYAGGLGVEMAIYSTAHADPSVIMDALNADLGAY